MSGALYLKAARLIDGDPLTEIAALVCVASVLKDGAVVGPVPEGVRVSGL